MSAEYEGQDPLVIAHQAEKDLNSHQAKHGVSHSSSGTSVCLPIYLSTCAVVIRSSIALLSIYPSPVIKVPY